MSPTADEARAIIDEHAYLVLGTADPGGTHGVSEWDVDDVRPPAPFRLYRATASEHSMLAKDGAPDHRVPVDITV